jgi:diguanylate cyclase (GGDEF)-like protein
MLDRLAMRALFWSALAIFAGAGGLLSVGTPSFATSSGLMDLAGPFQLLPNGLPNFTQAAPFLSLASFTMALAGLALLRRELSRRTTVDPNETRRAQQLHDAMQASADGIFFLRALRDGSGAVIDFEISDANASGARFVHRDPVALVGRRLRRDFPASVHEPLFARYVELLGAHETLTEDVRVSRREFASGWVSHHVVPTADGLAVTVRDVSAHKREALQLRRASLTDDLTRLYNRRGFLTLADQQLRIARRQMKDALLLYVDMDEFKELNDRHGHAEGDRALAAVGRLLRRAVRDCDVVARMGGDEFTIMALDADRAAARIIQRRIEERVALLNASGELSAPVSLTIGHTRVRPTDTAGIAELMARADSLLYARKKRRKLTNAMTATAMSRQRPRSSLNHRPVSAPSLVVPPDVAAIARAAAVAAASRMPTAANGTPYVPRRMA